MTRSHYSGLIQQLPAEDRNLLDDVLVRGCDFAEIASALVEPADVVRRRYRSLVARLRRVAQGFKKDSTSRPNSL